jgi:hypothetical protein
MMRSSSEYSSFSLQPIENKEKLDIFSLEISWGIRIFLSLCYMAWCG